MEEQESRGTRSNQSAVMDDFLFVFSIPQIPKKVMHCWSDCVSTTTCAQDAAQPLKSPLFLGAITITLWKWCGPVHTALPAPTPLVTCWDS